MMTKLCYNYDSGEYEYIDEDGYSHNSGEYVSNWDDGPYKREKTEREEEERMELERRMRLLYDERDDE